MTPSTAPQAFEVAARRFASRTAVISETGESWTYAQLAARRMQAARALIACGVQPGDRVAIWAQNCEEWIVAGLAAHAVGAVLVPINTRMKGEEAGYILARSRARVLFSSGFFLGQHYPGILGHHRPKTLEAHIVLRDAQPGDHTWEQFLARGDPIAEDRVRARDATIEPDSPMDIMFTSGTTGQPKGVVTGHAQNLKAIAEWSHKMGLVEHDRYLVANPFFHTFGYKVGWLGGLLAGLAVMPHAVFDAAAILRRISQERVTVLPGPPTLFISLLGDPARASADLSSLRATITGAATIAPALIERIRSQLGFRIVLTGYGLTETCGIVSLADAQDSAETIATTCGKAIADTEVRCVDAVGEPVPAGESGEIVVRGYNVMQGYFEDERATAEAIDGDGWLHTGDVGTIDALGNLRITDRLKDMYIAGGFNCYPAEIERMMAAHPGIAQVAVVGVPDERLGEVGKAFVVPRPGQEVDEAELIAWCRDKMANYKVPRFVEWVAGLPTNSSGKVLKYQLRERSKRGAA
ncbi:MAG TPA: FadD3 family acyl-CoA ligase [Verrucomicrobiae bacterium]|nr:FadD3 family acyl-CoA ligase [Verrucomicrobiae bacterium]